MHSFASTAFGQESLLHATLATASPTNKKPHCSQHLLLTISAGNSDARSICLLCTRSWVGWTSIHLSLISSARPSNAVLSVFECVCCQYGYRLDFRKQCKSCVCNFLHCAATHLDLLQVPLLDCLHLSSVKASKQNMIAAGCQLADALQTGLACL